MDIEVEDSKNCPVEIVSTENNKSPEVQRRKCGQNVSELLAQYFKWHGSLCATHPQKVIFLMLVFVAVSCLGLLNFQTEANAIKLWIPAGSDFARDYDYLWSRYPPNFRMHSVIFTSDQKNDPNILQPKYIQQVYQAYKNLTSMQLADNKTWWDFCLKVPIVKVDLAKIILGNRKKREENDFFSQFEDGFIEENDFREIDPSVEYYPSPYCSLIEGFEKICYEFSILELWAQNGHYNDSTFERLTEADILYKVNNVNRSGLSLVDKDFQSLLGGIERDSNGQITSAAALELKIIGHMNGTAAKLQTIKADSALGEYVEESTLDFESHLITIFLAANHNTVGMKTYVNVARSFNDIASETIISDTGMVVLGFSVVCIYVTFVLGKFDCIENRCILSNLGLLAVGMTIFATYGICCTLGFAFSPLHNFIPFLLLGLGIDDMFVIMQSLHNLANPLNENVVQTISETLSRSGVAITVTSLTDVLAFGVGASTVLPALKSFCIFCGVGILIVYLIQSTFFVACLALDQRRIIKGRNGILPCLKCPKEENDDSDASNPAKMIMGGEVLQASFHHYSNFLLKIPTQICVCILTLGIFAISCWGNVELRQEFDPMWFLPKDSYLFQWHLMNEKFFPSQGELVHIFATDMKLPEELSKLSNVMKKLQNQSDIISNVDFWVHSFETYHNTNFESPSSIFNLTEMEFRQRLTQYLFSKEGSRHRLMFRYHEELVCGQPAPDIQMFTLEFTHHLFSGPKEQIPAMNRVKDIIREANFSGIIFPFSKGYAAWETDEVIAGELYRNLALAIGCITATTLILLSGWLGCIQVVFCVLLTLTNVAGFMHFWGLTIETVSSTNLIISIGLCVDCPAHIAHEFLASQGTKIERSKKALRNMGPAVLNGGFSTFLSFVLLANSGSHVFETFFKIFFLVVTFALYNGLVVLPILLSHLGPKASHHFAYSPSTMEKTTDSTAIKNGDQENQEFELTKKMLPQEKDQ